ncbi:L-2-hydroxyglutarate oxidase LhgO [Gimesia panareensis]|uniref:L-2-hydroxyglutarate oxidase LhgO n=1 Tax=Gimesia panareensis TaxID=2527978 RepID=A0A518FTM1_9PLAN|nr:L-2-hydroxyglutarate oxidase [Gimesia panareensis]QDV19697.1 L-2-hydroxyglutarate oxidase LhgO [Gimesia panareensis]
MKNADVAIIGGGIVGLATGWQITQRFPQTSVLILEKENEVALHQTGHNSGVLHSGIYYKPGSLRATNCREGIKAMKAFCTAEEIPWEECGKVIVAVDESEFGALENIFQRGQQNGVVCEMIDEAKLKEYEPHVAGIRGIHVPETGIVDFRQVSVRLAERIQEKGQQIETGAEVVGIKHHSDGITLQTRTGEFTAKQVINCGGLFSDRVARLGGAHPDSKIVPFRGEYFELKPEAEHLCKALIYPVPNPEFPFLGVHFTKMIHGGVECGPNAVWAFAREGYTKSDINLRDLLESATYPGFLKMACKYWKTGLKEMWRSFSKPAFVEALQRLIPEIKSEHLEAAPAGVRAMALGPDGSLIDDFLFDESDRMINVLNAPSPAATSSLRIGQTIVDLLAPRIE